MTTAPNPLAWLLDRRAARRLRVRFAWITPQLVQGPSFSSRDARLVAALGIDSVLDLRAEGRHDDRALARAGLHYHRLPMPEREPPAMRQIVEGWRDEESFADAFSGYYTDVEPARALVAEDGEEVVGYLVGCLDSRAAWDPAAVLARHAVRRLLLARPGVAGVVWRALADAAADAVRRRLPERRFLDPRWPAHLHIDLLAPARGRGVGRRLAGVWLERMREAGVGGCHVTTLAENGSAVAFFEAIGFAHYGAPRPVPGWRTREGGRLHVQVMVSPG